MTSLAPRPWRVPAPPPGTLDAVAADARHNLLAAIGLLLAAMLLFTLSDGSAKYLVGGGISPPQVLFVRYTVVVLVLAPALWLRRRDRPWYTHRAPLHVLRGLLLVGAALIFIFALRALPLALCTAISFASPLYVTALSMPILGESVGRRRWAAVGVGFLGVLVILRPGASAFQWAMLLPVVSSLCWALGLLITRLMRSSERALTVLAWSSVVGVLACAPLAVPLWQPPSTLQWAVLAGIGLGNALGQYLVINAFMMAQASLLAPFSYSSIVWSTLFGVIVFGNVPDAATFAGAAVLVGAGLYVWHRERARATVESEPAGADT